MADLRNASPTTPSNAPSRTQPDLRHVWTVLILFAAVLISTTSGLLTAAGGANVPTALLAAGAAFGGAVFLLISLYRFLTDNRE